MEFVVGFVATFMANYESKTGESLRGLEALRLVCEHLDSCPDSPFKRNNIQEIEDED